MEGKTKQISNTTKGILYNVLLSLTEEDTDIKELTKEMFGADATKLNRDEF